MRVLFVCLGNICRSPTAEGVLRALARECVLPAPLEIDSAGTAAYHVGEPPDRRSAAAAARRGIELSGAGRQVGVEDFDRFDLLLAMDRSNRHALLALAPDARAAAKVRLLREYDPEAVAAGRLDVPDPYHGGSRGFEDVLDVVTDRMPRPAPRARGHGAVVTDPVRGGDLPAPVADGLADACGVDVTAARSVTGGDINRAFAVTLSDGREVFVKWRPDAPAGDFASEAAGLRWLAAPGALAVPAVVALADAADAAPGSRWLALQWVPPGQLDGEGERALGHGLAAVHAAGAPAFGAAPPGTPAADDGGAAPLRIGPLVLGGGPLPDWPSFYAERRLRPLAVIAHDAGALPRGAAGDIERLCDRIAELAGPAEPPARLHGDLWSGNVLAGRDGRPWLIDPAAYGGHREVDLAMLVLFGSPATAARVREAYEEIAPLADGHQDRVGLWQLFPLLVHAALFGGGYGHSVHAVARRYVR